MIFGGLCLLIVYIHLSNLQFPNKFLKLKFSIIKSSPSYRFMVLAYSILWAAGVWEADPCYHAIIFNYSYYKRWWYGHQNEFSLRQFYVPWNYKTNDKKNYNLPTNVLTICCFLVHCDGKWNVETAKALKQSLKLTQTY